MFSDAKTLLMLSSLIEHGYDYHQRSVTGAVLCCAVLSKRTLSFFFLKELTESLEIFFY